MRWLVVLGLVALALVGLIGVELAAPPAVPVPPAPSVSLRPAALTAAAGDATARWRDVLLARPLFSPDRRPPEVVRSVAVAHALPRLTGVLVGPSGRRAIFADGAVVAEGGTLGPWRVARIAAGEVTLTGPAGPRVLRPAFAAGAPALPRPAAPVATPLAALAPLTPALLAGPK